MNFTTIEHHSYGSGNGTIPWRIRRVACVGLLMATSAGLGGLALGSRGVTSQPRDLRSVPQCISVSSAPRIETMEYRLPAGPCASKTVLDSNRTSTPA